MSDRRITEAIQQLAGTHLKDEVYIEVCNVTAVDEPSRTCTCEAVTGQSVTEIINVQLMAEVDDGILYLPTVGSTVIIGYTKRNPPFIMMMSQIDKVLFIVGGSSFQIIDGTIQFNDGSFGGLTKTQELKTQLDKTNQLLQALLNIISGAPIDEPGNGAPSAFQTALNAAVAGQSLGDYTNIENSTIKHGI